MFVAAPKNKRTLPQAPVHTNVTPAKYVVLDIETGHAPEEVILHACERWTPPWNVKDPAKIEERRKEAHEKLREKSALLDGAPIVAVSVRTEKMGVVFHGMDKKKYSIDKVEVVSSGGEREMLVDLRAWLDAATYDESVLVGFNILYFDLPKLRSAYVRHRLKLPNVLNPKFNDDRQPAIDLMKQFKYFSPECAGDYMVSFAEVLDRFGFADYKRTIDGSMVPDLVKAKKVKDILMYSALEGVALWKVFSLMNSTDTELE